MDIIIYLMENNHIILIIKSIKIIHIFLGTFILNKNDFKIKSKNLFLKHLIKQIIQIKILSKTKMYQQDKNFIIINNFVAIQNKKNSKKEKIAKGVFDENKNNNNNNSR